MNSIGQNDKVGTRGQETNIVTAVEYLGWIGRHVNIAPYMIERGRIRDIESGRNTYQGSVNARQK